MAHLHVHCDVTDCVYHGRADTVKRHQSSSNCPLYFEWNELVVIGELAEGKTDNRPRVCPVDQCEKEFIKRGVMNGHFYWTHVHLSGGYCYFCSVQMPTEADFSKHVENCLLGVIRSEITTWANAISRQQLHRDIFSEAIFFNIRNGLQYLHEIDSECLMAEQRESPIDKNSQKSLTYNEMLSNLQNASSMETDLPKYNAWFSEIQNEKSPGGVYVHIDETVVPTSPEEVCRAILVVGSSMTPDTRLGEHESLIADQNSTTTCPSDIEIREMRSKGRNIKGYVLIRNLPATSIRIFEHAIKGVICHTSIEPSNLRPCVTKNDKPPYSTYQDQLQFGIFLVYKLWTEWKRVATVKRQDYNLLADELEQLMKEVDELSEQNKTLQPDSGMKRTRPNEP